MEHGTHLVDVLDSSGQIIGQKKRRDINKAVDIYHTIYVFVITPKGELVLGTIPHRSDLPNLYADQLGVPMATIRRSNETAQQAAVRGVTRELFIDHPTLVSLGDGMTTFADKRRNFASVFYLIANRPSSHSQTDMPHLVTVSPNQFRTMVAGESNKIAPSLHEIWRLYSAQLPL